MSGISFRQIEVFRAVMITGSISAAAKQLGIAQPGVSNTIKRLEDLLGAQLFERSPSRLMPTETAHRIFEEVKKAYIRFDHLSGAIAEIVSRKGPLFRVGVSPSLSVAVAPRALAMLSAANAHLSIHCDTLSVSEVNQYLWFGTGHCAVTIFPVEHPLVMGRQLGEGRLVCVLPAAHPLAEKTQIELEDIADQRIIRFEEGSPHGRVVNSLFADRDTNTVPDVRIRFAYAALGMVQEGFGIAVVDSFTAVSATTPGVRAVPLANSPSLPVYLHWNREQPASVLTSEFADHLESVLASLSP